jgi:hypothetical protein
MVPDSEGTGKRDLSSHILSASVVMIGVSTTLAGLARVAKPHMGPSRVDEYAALVSLLFHLSAGASYLSIRYANLASLSRKCELLADQISSAGSFSICAIALFFAYERI